MSSTILTFARSFVDGRLTADEFANSFVELWKIERDSGLLRQDPFNVSELLSSAFCLADLYNPDVSRDAHELSGDQLREKISALFEKL